jgi:hypothetical protein
MLHDLYDYLYHDAQTGGLPLKGTGIALGIALIASHAWVWKNGAKVQAFLKSFPRTFIWGVILMVLSLLWAEWLLANMDMGEFYDKRTYFMLITAAGAIGMIVYVPEFLAVRAMMMGIKEFMDSRKGRREGRLYLAALVAQAMEAL